MRDWRTYERKIANASRFLTRRSVNIPTFIGLGLVGGAVGFTREILEDPRANAYIADYLNQGPDDTGTPLGYWEGSKYYPYSSGYYRSHFSNDLGASGELALALFATRHGR